MADALKIMPPKRRAVAPPVAVRPTAVGPADHELPAERDDDVPAVVLFHAGKVAKLSEASAGGGSLSRDEAEDAHGEDDGEIDTSVLTEAQQRECVELVRIPHPMKALIQELYATGIALRLEVQ